MGLLDKMKKGNTEKDILVKKVDRTVLNRVQQFIEDLDFPEALEKVCIKPVEAPKKHMRGRAQCYLVFDAENWINVGYAVGQAASFLRFQGIPSQVLTEVPEWMDDRDREDGRCAAALAVGMAGQALWRDRTAQPESPCIYMEARENWTEEVFQFAKERFLLPTGAVRVMRKNNRMYLGTKPASGKKAYKRQLEVGIAAANIMAAADELWIDVEMKKTDEPRMLLAICRKQEEESKQQGGRLEEAAERLSGRIKEKKHRWRYA